MDNPRDTPLEHCPDPVCRRSGVCRSTYAKQPCRRFFMSDDEWREELACLLERLWIEQGGNPEDLKQEPPEPTPEQWAALRTAVAERAAQIEPHELIPKWARERT